MIFVAHSLGGLVCANLIANGPEHITKSRHGIIFFSTPFPDNIEDWNEIAEKMAVLFAPDPGRENKNTADKYNGVTEWSGPVQTRNLFEEHLTNQLSGTEIAIFAENDEDVGEHDGGFIITPDHASVGEKMVMPLDAYHLSISKFRDRDDDGFKLVSLVLLGWNAQLVKPEKQRIRVTGMGLRISWADR